MLFDLDMDAAIESNEELLDDLGGQYSTQLIDLHDRLFAWMQNNTDKNTGLLFANVELQQVQGLMREAGLGSYLRPVPDLVARAIEGASALLPLHDQNTPPLALSEAALRQTLDGITLEMADSGSKATHQVQQLLSEMTTIPITPKDASTRLSTTTGMLQSRAETVVNTGLAQAQRSLHDESAQAIPAETRLRWYVGPNDGVTRKFCKKLENKALTDAEIGKLNNGHGMSVIKGGGGYNCRHHWIPISHEYAEIKGIEVVGGPGGGASAQPTAPGAPIAPELPDFAAPPQAPALPSFVTPPLAPELSSFAETSPPSNRPSADGTVLGIRRELERRRTEFGLDDIPPEDIEGRNQALLEHLGRSATEEAGRSILSWTTTSNPFSLFGQEGRYLRFLSHYMGTSNLDEDLDVLGGFYADDATPEKVETYREEYEAFTTPGTEDHDILKALIGQRVIWTDYMRSRGQSHLTLMRGMVLPTKEEADDLIENPDDLLNSSASSFTESEDVGGQFASNKGGRGVIVEARIPLEHCLLGYHTHEGVGEQELDDDEYEEHEYEVIVGSVKNATFKVRKA